jgi:hypothetical protein
MWKEEVVAYLQALSACVFFFTNNNEFLCKNWSIFVINEDTEDLDRKPNLFPTGYPVHPITYNTDHLHLLKLFFETGLSGSMEFN